MPDIQRPTDDPYDLVQGGWPAESETAYTAAETAAGDASTTASTQSAAADDAARQTSVEMQGKTADAVSDGYDHAATQLSEQSRNFTTIAGWMGDAAGKVSKAKNNIASLVVTGTSEIRDALDSELRGTPVTPSSSDLITQYRGEIAQSATQLTTDLDSIGHSLHGDPGASTTPTYVRASSTPTTPTVEQAAVHQGITGESQAPQVTPKALPEMPRAVTAQSSESPSGAGAPSAPSAPTVPHPTLSNLISAQGTPVPSTGTATPHTPSPTTGTPSTPSPQPSERHQQPKTPGLPRIPSLPLDGLPAAAAESVATVVSAAAGHQLSTAAQGTPSIPASTGITPGVPGTPPMAPVTPTPLTPIGGGGLTPPPVAQPAPQVAPAAPSSAPQQTPTRSPAADLSWIQRTYGLAPGVELPKSETALVPAIFITELPEDAVHLHRALATIRQQFEQSGWAQPLAVATIRKGFESKLVYVTADGVSIHPQGVSLPTGLTPLGEIPSAPTYPELSGSLMVTDKLKALLPRGWELEGLLSTLPSDESHQSAEQYRELVGAGELLECTASRGRSDVEPGEAMAVFARAALGSAGCGDLDSESARLRGSRWIGVQPAGYGEVLSRWYLADAAESMGSGRWGDAVYSAGKYLSITDAKRQVA